MNVPEDFDNDEELANLDLDAVVASAGKHTQKSMPTPQQHPHQHPQESTHPIPSSSPKATIDYDEDSSLKPYEAYENVNDEPANKEDAEHHNATECPLIPPASSSHALNPSKAVPTQSSPNTLKLPESVCNKSDYWPFTQNQSPEDKIKQTRLKLELKTKKVQLMLQKQFLKHGADKIGHIGVLTRSGTESSPTPRFFFLRDSTVTLGAGRQKCDIILPGMFSSNMSDTALKITLQNEHLHAESLNSVDLLFRIHKADGSFLLMATSQSHEIFRKDFITYEQRQDIKILFHRAPLPANPSTKIVIMPPGSSATKPNAKCAYPKSRPQDIQKAKKMKGKVAKAASRLKSRKKMLGTEHKRAKALLARARDTQCAYERKFRYCTDKECPFRHSMKDNKKIGVGEEVTGNLRVWHQEHGYGFVVNEDGQEFFMHHSQLSFDSKDIYKGVPLRFHVRANNEKGKADKAINIMLA